MNYITVHRHAMEILKTQKLELVNSADDLRNRLRAIEDRLRAIEAEIYDIDESILLLNSTSWADHCKKAAA